MATTTNNAWYQSDPEKGYKDRLNRIQKMRDPGTFADEILRGASGLLILSLFFTGALCYFSYQFFLVKFLPYPAAIAAAVAITVLIEYGKSRVGMAALRIPFLQGFAYIKAKPENTFMFLGSLVFALVIFSISVYNSTHGAARYAEKSSTENTEEAFTPNTEALDAQIAATQRNIDNAPKAKWKGKEYYQSPKSVASAQRTVEKLTATRDAEITRQRSDFERRRSFNDSDSQHAGGIALRIGGWLELIQVILMFLKASCERVLDRRSSTSTQSSPASQSQKGIGFHTAGVTAQAGQSDQQAPAQQNPQPPRQQIGFHVHENRAPITVPQIPQAVPQENATKGYMTVVEADEALLFHLQRLQKEPSNLQRKDVNKETVLRRIVGIMADMSRTLTGIDSCSVEVSERIINYWYEKVQPILDANEQFYDPFPTLKMLRSRAKGGEQA